MRHDSRIETSTTEIRAMHQQWRNVLVAVACLAFLAGRPVHANDNGMGRVPPLGYERAASLILPRTGREMEAERIFFFEPYPVSLLTEGFSSFAFFPGGIRGAQTCLARKITATKSLC